MLFWQGTKGISKQTFKSLSTLLTGQRLQRYRQQPDLQNHRDNLVHEVTRRVKSLQKSQGKLTPSTSKQSKQMCYLSCLHTTHIHMSYLSALMSVLFDCHSSEPRSVNFVYLFLGGKKNSTPMKEKRLRSREGSKPSIQKARSQQPKALFPTPTPRSKAPPQNQTPKTLQKKNRYIFFFLTIGKCSDYSGTNEN